MVKTAFFAADQDEGAQRGSRRPIPPLVSEIQAATTNAGTKPQGGLTPDFLALSLKAFGQVPKSLFILQVIDDPVLRQAIEKQLDRIEHAPRFTRAVSVGHPRGFLQ